MIVLCRMRNIKSFVLCATVAFLASAGAFGVERRICKEVLQDKIAGYWVGQLVGNYMGMPFEHLYIEKPVGLLVERYYNHNDREKVKLHLADGRGYTDILARQFEGAWTDDDTDIEFVTLFAVEKYGLDITYRQIADVWKKHINRRIWSSHRQARELMEQGLMPPDTGSRKNNRYWFTIGPQFSTEIWAVFYPGMIQRALQKSRWAARITSDAWGVDGAMAYAVLYSGAFFESDVNELVNKAVAALGQDSPFRAGISDVVRWHAENKDWRQTRAQIHRKYWRYRVGDFEVPARSNASLINCLCSFMAILYGRGDFVRTVGIAVSAGYDCDCNAATCGGLIGVIHGAACIPDRLTMGVGNERLWDRAFNNRYVNYTRDQLPVAIKITDIVEAIADVAGQAIIENAGSLKSENGTQYYVVQCDF